MCAAVTRLIARLLIMPCLSLSQVVNPALYTPSAKARDTGKRFSVRYGGGVSSAGKVSGGGERGLTWI